MAIFLKKLRETAISVFPIVVIVLLLHFTIVPLKSDTLYIFIIGAALVIFGLTLFILGVDIGLTPIGNKIGSSMARTGKVFIVLSMGLLLGLVITVAEPSLIILANQIELITSSDLSAWFIISIVSIGVAVFVALGLLRILYQVSLRLFLLVSYILVFVLAVLSPFDFLGIAFDASGATTGALAVPFILAISLGTSNIKKDSKKGETDSFGLVGIASVGAIMMVLILGVFSKFDKLAGSLEIAEVQELGVFEIFIKSFPKQFVEVFVAILPIFLIFVFANKLSFKLKKIKFIRIFVGLIFSFFGLVFFLLGINKGFMEVGTIVGAKLSENSDIILMLFIGFVLGLVTILAEPAVHILTRQIEEVTSAYVKGKLVMVTLALGVAFAVALAVLKVTIPALQLWHILLPGYLLSIVLMFFAPDLFVGIAFDSGGVASGPMTATFVLAFIQGIAANTEGADVVADGFGVISMVAMIPLIALQILGIVYKVKTSKLERK